MRDFNCVLNKDGRIGSPVSLSEIRDFKHCVEVCSLKDLRSSGAIYTWNNKHGDSSRVYSKIDRVLVNSDWITTLPSSEAHFGNEGLMDHCLVIINWKNREQPNQCRFKYFNMWSHAPNFQRAVKLSWERGITGSKMFGLVGKLKRLKSTLQEINKVNFSEVEVNTEKTKKELDECQNKLHKDPKNLQLIEHEMRFTKDYHKWKLARDQYFIQKYKIQWLNYGDLNTKFFHSILKARRNTNRIFTISNNNGDIINDLPGITQSFVEFYTSLLGSSSTGKTRVCSSTMREGLVVLGEHRKMLVE
ncbi:uncharacterized protein LOC142171806 [Nicotiana tabacum]|uniref:Uncharacterized protein LOC142171806 n=1 Tax=Nicotiana tabacum TaxID=4097 RepID=A0AC58T335_TOBAC